MVPRRGRRLGLNFDVQAIPALYDGAQDPPLWVADRAPNLAYALSDIVLGDRHVGPDGVEQLVARHQTARVAGQRQKKGEGFRSQRDLCSIAVAQQGAVDLERHVSEPEHLHGGKLRDNPPFYRRAARATMRNREVGSATLSFGAKYRESRAGRLAVA